MKACVCVDYLSHEWSSTDLIQAHIELKRQRSKNIFNNLNKTKTPTPKELKKLSIEKVRQVRYQNAIWRQMARSCTQKLSSSNEMIHPSIVNWQKESDVTWLYGPLYMPPESSSDLITHPSLSFNNTTTILKKVPKSTLKPVLKKQMSSLSSNILLQKDYWVSTNNTRYWSKCASDSGKQSVNCVRFNPNITEVKFLPETPVKESLFNKQQQHSSYFSIDSEGEEEDESEDDEDDIWTVIIQVGSYFKSVLFTTLFTPTKPTNSKVAKNQQQMIKSNNHSLFNFELIQFCVSSAVSFTAWIMYQTVTTIIYKRNNNAAKQPQIPNKRRSNLLSVDSRDNSVTAA